MKLMIVEDETLCRESLVSIPWDTVGVRLIDSACSATDAIEKIRRTPPDIIITDIEMEDGNGFQLAEEVSYILPGVKIIFLTAYNKFEYAQKAIHYKAYAFILKPLNRHKLLQAVQNARTEIQEARAEQEKHQQLLTDFNNCKYFLKDYFFSTIEQDTRQVASLFHLEDTNACFQVVIVCHFDQAGTMKPLSFQIFSDILAILDQCQYGLIPFYDQDMLTFVFRWDPPSGDKTVFDFTFEAASAIKNYMKYHNDTHGFTVAIGSAADGAATLPYGHLRAKEALKYRFSLGENEIVYIDDIEPRERSIVNIDELKTQLIDNIKIGNMPLAEKVIHTIFHNMKENYTSIDLAQRMCFELFIMISIAMAQLGQNPDNLFNKSEIWTVLKNYQSLSHLKKLMIEVTELSISLINSNREEKTTDIINQVKELVESNVESDISLQEMAKRIYISPCYLSSLFKMKTGVSYKNYTIQVKINKAKELLTSTDLPIYEIATTLGYKSNQHFSHLFQAQTGLLPTEYRSRNRRE